MRIAILTGGGDVPGLNQCLKAAVLAADQRGWEVLGIRRGWQGLLDYNPADPAATYAASIEALTPTVVRAIDQFSGSYLHTSRVNPQRLKPREVPAFLAAGYPVADVGFADCTEHILAALRHLQVDAVVVIGGDDTLSYAVRLHREGIAVVGIPKTMDNDVHGTDYCLGFSTAVTRSIDFIHALRAPTASHERIAVVELFGRTTGETSLIVSYLADVDRALISEVPFDVDRLAAMLAEDRRNNPGNYAVVTVSEGARLSGGSGGERWSEAHRLGGVGIVLGEALQERTGVEIVNQRLAYLMRAGAPDSLDRMVATSFGRLAVGLIDQSLTGRMVAVRTGVYTTVPIETPTLGSKRVDIDELYDAEQYRPRVSHLLGKPMFLY
jgi:6-phosphofructokinase 1